MPVTCDILFDLVNLADGVVPPEHVQIEGLRVFTNTLPCGDVRSCPSSEENLEPVRY